MFVECTLKRYTGSSSDLKFMDDIPELLDILLRTKR